MRRELYINGRLADIDGVAIPLTFACSEIADLSGVSGNYSLTVKLPLTGPNILIAYFANLPNTSPAALWNGYKTTGSYFVDGVPIFQNADVRLLSSEKTIDVQITFGNLTWLDVLANIKLKDIVSEFFTAFQYNWNYWIVENEGETIRWVMVDWGGTFESGVHAERMHPAINVYNLWDAVWEKLNQLGVIWKQPDFFPETDLWMPIMSQILNPALPVGAEFTMAANLQLTDQVDSANVFDGFSEFEYTTPNTGIVFDNIKRYFIIPKEGLYRVQINSNIIITTTVIGYEGVSIDFQLKYRDGGLSESVFNGSWTHGGTGVETYPVIFDKQIKYKKGDVIYMDMICEQEGTPGYECRVELDASSPIFSIDYIPVLNKKDQLEFLMPYDIAYNMPDISCKDFVKAVMQLYGVLVENTHYGYGTGREKYPNFFNIDFLKSDRIPNDGAINWSDKLVSFDRPKIEWNLGLKERNYLRYTEDETDNIFEDAYFTTYETDNSEKDLFKSIFAASDDVSLIGTSYFPVPVCSIPQWVVDEKTDEWKYEGKCKQRIFRAYLHTATTFDLEIVQLFGEEYDQILIDETFAYISYFKDVPADVTWTNQGLDMASIITKYYQGFIDAVKSNRLFTFQFLLNQIDINKFTHITPVWIEKFSNYFFVKKILNWEAGRVCNVEMLQLYDSGEVAPAPTPAGLELTFDDIANVPVADASSVSDWNTFFDLPTNGTEFSSVEVVGDMVRLIGGSEITTKVELFFENTNLIKFDDKAGCIVELGNASLASNVNIIYVNLPECTTIGDSNFVEMFFDGIVLQLPKVINIGNGCISAINFHSLLLPECLTIGNSSISMSGAAMLTNIENISIPKLAQLGDSVDDNLNFRMTGYNFTITIPAALMTCNGGNPDGDIQYLQANNTVTIVTV